MMLATCLEDESESVFQHLVDLLVRGEHDVAFVFSAYFDESFDDDLLCVAGYFFVKSKLREFEKRWQAMLDRFELPYFRMSACAHGHAPFDKLSLEQRIEAQTIAIRLIRRYADYGVAMTVNPKEFAVAVQKNRFVWNAYQFLTWLCLIAGRTWMDEHRPNGQTAFFFEAGHKHQKSANAMMAMIMSKPELKQAYRSAAFSFVDKTELPCQAADVLSWQWFKDSKRRRDGTRPEPRADCRALVSTGHETLHADAGHLDDLMLTIARASLDAAPVSLGRSS